MPERPAEGTPRIVGRDALPYPDAREERPRAGSATMLANLLYGLYERRLGGQVRRAGGLPRHIGIILDGNRRHGQQQGLTDPRAIYAAGARKLDDVLDWCADLGVAAVTLWVLSTDNLGRPLDQVSGILGAIEGKMRSLATDPAIHRRRVRVQAIGRLDLLPASTVAAIEAACRATSAYEAMVLTIAVAYGGREEIVDAVRALLDAVAREGGSLADASARVDAETIGRHLYLTGLPDPDLIIRTSGEIRLSGFLLWQSAHSEFYFSDVYWPAFRRIDFLRAIRAYQQRSRRYGQ